MEKTMFDPLIRNLKEEIELLRFLSDALEKEREILVRSDVRELVDHNGKKETLILKMRMLEEVRRTMIRKISRDHGLAESATLVGLASCADPSRRETLLALRESITALAAAIGERNEANREIIGVSLRHAQGSMDFLGELMNPDKTYGQSGKWNRGKKKGNVLNTEG